MQKIQIFFTTLHIHVVHIVYRKKVHSARNLHLEKVVPSWSKKNVITAGLEHAILTLGG